MDGIEPSHTNSSLTYPLNTSDFSAPDDHDVPNIPSILAGLIVPHTVCTIFLLARVWSRLFLLRKWFHDDTLISAAWLFSTAVCAAYSVAAQAPDLRSAVLLGTTDASYALSTYLGLIFYQLCLLLTKLSILSFYLRMFSSRPVERRLAIGTIVFVILYGAPLLFISVFQCHPSSSPSAFFSHRIPKCFSFAPLLIASASLHTATDAWLIVMIAPVIARLAIPRGQKVALATVLSLSVFVIAASLTRLQLSLHNAGYSSPAAAGAGARVANTLAFFVMTVLECDVALLCACAPTLRPVLARVWPVLGLGEGGAADGERRRRRRLRRLRRRLRRLRRRRVDGTESQEEEEEDEEDSVNLTVVSYHGYPWAQNGTAATAASRSKDGSNAANMAGGEMAMPVPPPPTAFPGTHRTPTTLSLRSFMSSMAPRSRGQTVSMREDREVLLGDEVERKRRSSVGFEGYYDQYLGYGEDRGEKRRSRARNSGVGGNGTWGESQESFVLGVNDPASPSRLSPVSALSGTTFAAIADEARVASRDGKAQRE